MLALTALFVLAYPPLHEALPFLHDHFRSHDFLGQFAHEVASTDTLADVQTDSTAGDTLAEAEAMQPEETGSREREYPAGAAYTGVQYIQRFLKALERAKRGRRVRVAYFGDSMIEGDLVTESLRNDLQTDFGGIGVGFVPIACAAPGFRKTIKHSFSSNWKFRTILVPNPTDFNYGIAGTFAYLPGSAEPNIINSWAKYEATEQYEGTRNFPRVRLYYGKELRPEDSLLAPHENWVAIETDKGVDTVKLNRKNEVNAFTLPYANLEEISLNFRINNRLPVYGLSIEGNKGVYVDNFAVRGNSGLGILNIPSATWQQFNRYMKYDLVILHYGLNVIDSERKSYKGYEKHFKKVIAYVKEQLPEADILVVSVSDKSSMIDGEMQTDPSVPKIVAAQRRAAEENQVGFINLYQGMGGRNTMVKWVEANWASKDYTHVNRKGAKRISDVIKKFLMTEYAALQPKDPQQLASGTP